VIKEMRLGGQSASVKKSKKVPALRYRDGHETHESARRLEKDGFKVMKTS